MRTFIRQHYKWIIFLVLISLGSLAGELINNRFTMSDLEVYHKTAVRLSQGEELYRSVEEDPWEHYVFKYSPPSAFLFLPFVFTGFTAAKYLYWAFLTFILGHILFLLYRIFIPGGKASGKVILSLILAMAIGGTHFFRELHLGQVNLVLLWFYIIALYAFQKNNSLLSGVMLAASLFIKPFALIFIPFLLISRRYKTSLYMLAFTIIFFLLPFIFYPDLSLFKGLYASWINELGIELGNKQDLLAAGNHTIFSVLARYTPISLLPIEGSGRWIYQLIILLFIAAIVLRYMLKDSTGEGYIKIFIILTAMIPLLAFTSYNAFIFSLPLFTFLLFHFGKMSLIIKIIFIVSCLLIGGNIYDVAGPGLFDLFWEISVYSWGTMGLVIITFMNWDRFQINSSGSL